MSAVTKQVQLLLLPEDEAHVFRAVRAAYPEVKLLADVPWGSADRPPARESVQDCGASASIWNPAVHPRLQVDVRSNGAIFGPGIGPVVQWMRSLEKEPGVLDSGRWAASFDKEKDPEMAKFVSGLWRILNRLTTNRILRAAGPGASSPGAAPERRFRVGEKAVEWALEGKLTLRSGGLYLRPEDA
ncbi:hypothetical protein [Streptomyces sp. NBC_00996]|uniref:hypothetical protein n=1 Tax=Streptomyces sp. NBC_00996 TaxID=2903710 RepID=UPI00386420F5|nr:hypothetical protein OG390_21105 [Streptomyces sp. NBC_00996]